MVHQDPEAVLTQVLKWSTVATEGLFLTRSSLELLEGLFAKFALKDKAATLILKDSDTPLSCALDAAVSAELTAYKKTISYAQRAKLATAFSFTVFAYAFTMNESTEAFLKGNLFYDWLLDSTLVKQVPVGAAALNLTACYNYSYFLLNGVNALLDPIFRLYKMHLCCETRSHDGISFFEREVKEAADQGKTLNYSHAIIAYSLKYAFVVLSAYLTYTSSVERAKAGESNVSAFVEFCQTYLLPTMAIIVNSGALVELPGACLELLKGIGHIASWLYHRAMGYHPHVEPAAFNLKKDFGPTDLRHLRNNIAVLNAFDSKHPKILDLNAKLEALNELQSASASNDTEFLALIGSLALCFNNESASESLTTPLLP